MTRLIAAVVGVLLCALATADARPQRHHSAVPHKQAAVEIQVDDRFAPGPVAPAARRATKRADIAPDFGADVSDVLTTARRFIGATAGQIGLPARLWCADFMNMVLHKTGHAGTGSRKAASFAGYGRRVPGPKVGAIAVMSRRGGGHVGVVSGIDRSGNPIVISGNHGRRVGEAVYPRRRIYAYVMPR